MGPAARPILKSETPIWLKQVNEKGRSASKRSRSASPSGEDGRPLSLAERDCLAALRAWRAEVAREHNLPAFVIFHDSTLSAIAQRRPARASELEGISGLGEKKREAYGTEVLRVVKPFL